MKSTMTWLMVLVVLAFGWNGIGLWAEEGATPPAGGETPPAGGETPPAGGETPPAGGETPPAGGDAGKTTGPKTEGGALQMDLIELIKAGGTIGYIIMLLSVVGLGLVFENMYTVRRSALMPDEVVGEVERLFQEENYEEALNLCDSEPSLLTNMLGAGLTKLQGGYDAMTDAMGEALEEGATRIHQKINYLDLIANVAPMLGLLGTVQGMIQAFMKLAGGTPKPGELAGDISLALVTTAQGLIVAIPMLTFKMIIKNRIVRILMEVSAVSNELVERFKSK